MSDIDAIFARSLHHTSKSTRFGEAFAPPIVNTSVYRLDGEPTGPYQYARWGNPTWTALEDALAVLEDAETVTFPSGMAAIASVLYSALKLGDRVLLPSDGYYTVRLFAEKYLRSMGVIVDFCATIGAPGHALDGTSWCARNAVEPRLDPPTSRRCHARQSGRSAGRGR